MWLERVSYKKIIFLLNPCDKYEMGKHEIKYKWLLNVVKIKYMSKLTCYQYNERLTTYSVILPNRCN